MATGLYNQQGQEVDEYGRVVVPARPIAPVNPPISQESVSACFTSFPNVKRDSIACLVALGVGAYTQSFFKGLAAGLLAEVVTKQLGLPGDVPQMVSPVTQQLSALLVNWAREQKEDY